MRVPELLDALRGEHTLNWLALQLRTSPVQVYRLARGDSRLGLVVAKRMMVVFPERRGVIIEAMVGQGEWLSIAQVGGARERGGSGEREESGPA